MVGEEFLSAHWWGRVKNEEVQVHNGLNGVWLRLLPRSERRTAVNYSRVEILRFERAASLPSTLQAFWAHQYKVTGCCPEAVSHDLQRTTLQLLLQGSRICEHSRAPLTACSNTVENC